MEKQTYRQTVKTCYDHIGGKLGSLLLEQFVSKGWIRKERPSDKYFFITGEGEKEFCRLGIDLSQIKAEKI